LFAQIGSSLKLLHGFLPRQGFVPIGQIQQIRCKTPLTHLRASGAEQLKQGTCTEEIQIPFVKMIRSTELVAGSALAGPVSGQPVHAGLIESAQAQSLQSLAAALQKISPSYRRHRQDQWRKPDRRGPPGRIRRDAQQQKNRQHKRQQRERSGLFRVSLSKTRVQALQPVLIFQQRTLEVRHRPIVLQVIVLRG